MVDPKHDVINEDFNEVWQRIFFLNLNCQDESLYIISGMFLTFILHRPSTARV